MNKRFVSVVIFALIVSGLASLLIYRMVVSRIATAAKKGDKSIVVAARNLQIGTLIKDVDLKMVDWAAPVPAQAARKKEDAVGRGVIAAIYEGEPLLDSRLAPKGGGAGMAALIPKGMRAVAVKVNEVVGVAGFVVPGMRVDVLISGVPPGGTRMDRDSQTKTILQNIEVLSAGQNIQKDAEGKPVSVTVVNLLVTPEQAESLSLASNEARIQLVLRNPLDSEQAKTSGTAMAQLFGRPAAPPPAPKPVLRTRAAAPAKPAAVAPVVQQVVRVKVVEVLHGAKKTEAKFEKPSEVNQ